MSEVWRRRHGARMVRQGVLSILAIAVASALVSGCKPSEPLHVMAIQTGKSLNSDNSVATHAASFRPKDTMYVSVLTDARGSGTITTRWSLGGRVINEVKKDVSYNDAAATDFRFQAADGFPVGEYTIEVLVDGMSVGTRRVRVE
jgi:hypothetical protein